MRDLLKKQLNSLPGIVLYFVVFLMSQGITIVLGPAFSQVEMVISTFTYRHPIGMLKGKGKVLIIQRIFQLFKILFYKL